MNRTLVKNIFSYSLANILSKITIFIFNAIAARYYGKYVFGTYNYAVAIVSYFIMFANMGIQSYASYELAKRPSNYNDIFSEVVSSELFLGILSSIALIIYTALFPVHSTMILIVGTTIMISSLDISWLFQARQETKYVSLQITINSFLSLILLIFAVWYKLNNEYILPVIVSITQLFAYLLTWITAIKKLNIKLKFSLKHLKMNMEKGIPFLFSGVFAAINCNIDIIILTLMKGSNIVGVYSAIYKIINIIILIVSYVVSPAFPEMIKLFVENKKTELEKIAEKLWTSCLLVVFPIVIGGLILGGKIIIYIFGVDYNGGDCAFKILLIYCLVFCFREKYGYILTMIGKQKVYMIIVFISCVSNISLNIALIPSMGINGAAITTLVSEIINFILMKIISKRYIVLKTRLFKMNIFIPSLIMGLVVWIMSSLDIKMFLIILTGVIVYAVNVYFFWKKSKE